MHPGERYRFIHTLKMASERQDYQNLVKTHTKQFRSIHNKKQFLAWHRWYLLKMENILREVDPIVTVPYWDWSLWSGEPWLNEIMSVWSDAPWGFGGNGGGRDNCVYSGPFRKDQWWLPDGGCLKRKFNGKPPDCIAVHKCLRTSYNNFPEFERTLRVNLHNDMHCRIGGNTGTMCGIYSANAPEFLLHHAFTDKIWTDWQKKGSRYKNAYTQGTIKLYGISPRLRPQNLLDQFKQPGGVCVLYDDPTHESYKLCHDQLASLSIAEIDAIPRRSFTRLSNLEFDLFVANERERTMANREMQKLEPRHVLSKNTKLNSQDNRLGFKVEDVKEATERKKKKRGEIINSKQN